MKVTRPFDCQIWVGLMERDTGHVHSLDEVREIVQAYVDDVQQCFTVAPTEYIYVLGSEPGAVVGLIHYPRFPSTSCALRTQALELAKLLGGLLQQYKVTVCMPEETVMLEKDVDYRCGGRLSQVGADCECGRTHVGVVTGQDGQLIEWWCPATGKRRRDVNA